MKEAIIQNRLILLQIYLLMLSFLAGDWSGGSVFLSVDIIVKPIVAIAYLMTELVAGLQFSPKAPEIKSNVSAFRL